MNREQSYFDRRCERCGQPTMCEEAWINGQIWCHPCADERSYFERSQGATTFDPELQFEIDIEERLRALREKSIKPKETEE